MRPAFLLALAPVALFLPARSCACRSFSLQSCATLARLCCGDHSARGLCLVRHALTELARSGAGFFPAEGVSKHRYMHVTSMHIISSTASRSRKNVSNDTMQCIQECTCNTYRLCMFLRESNKCKGWLPDVRRFLSALALTPGLAASRPTDRPALPTNAATSHFATIPRQRRGRERTHRKRRVYSFQ